MDKWTVMIKQKSFVAILQKRLTFHFSEILSTFLRTWLYHTTNNDDFTIYLECTIRY